MGFFLLQISEIIFAPLIIYPSSEPESNITSNVSWAFVDAKINIIFHWKSRDFLVRKTTWETEDAFKGPEIILTTVPFLGFGCLGSGPDEK